MEVKSRAQTDETVIQSTEDNFELDIQWNVKVLCQTFAGSSFFHVQVFCFKLNIFGLLVEQKKLFEDITFGLLN